MITDLLETDRDAFLSAYEALMGAHVIAPSILTARNRDVGLAAVYSCATNLFLDPDKGLRIGNPSPQHISAVEFIQIVKRRPNFLTAVFDQCFDRRDLREQRLIEKLNYLAGGGIHAFAYDSHACFIVAAAEKRLADAARARLIAESHLPERRLRLGTAAS
jgi:hypothetical protein